MAESNEEKHNHEIEMSVKECPVVSVTVYKDRAEVRRSIDTTVKAGVNELRLVELVEVEEDSIRVEGKGNATIAEVSFQRKFVAEDEATMSDKEKELSDKLKALKEEEKTLGLEAQKGILNKQWTILEKFADTATKFGQGSQKDEKGLQLDDVYFSGMRNFMQQHLDIGKQLEAEKIDIDKTQEDLQKKIEIAANNLSECRGDRYRTTENRECMIVLEADAEVRVNLIVSYVVYNTSWYPSYDLRMNTELGELKIFYYGLISQNSGEDWNDVKLYLSTAEPSVGGSIPTLPMSHLILRKFKPPPVFKSRTFKSYGHSPDMEANNESSFGSMRMWSSPLQSLPKMDCTEIQVSESTTSTSYEINRQSSIPSDNTDHKVTVAVLMFKPRTTYLTVPKVVPHAFLQAKVSNTSPYTLLPGQTNIFLDNSFVAKATLSAVAPKEEFECSLGVDPGVRVDYKPLIKMTSTTGILTKWESISHEQVIEVKNMHDYDVEVLVRDNLPRSMDEKIKVNLLQPYINEKHPEKGIRITKNNHVEWDLKIQKLAKMEVVLKYTVEHPMNEEIETNMVVGMD